MAGASSRVRKGKRGIAGLTRFSPAKKQIMYYVCLLLNGMLKLARCKRDVGVSCVRAIVDGSGMTRFHQLVRPRPIETTSSLAGPIRRVHIRRCSAPNLAVAPI